MDRVPYRRVATSRDTTERYYEKNQPAEGKSINFGETLIMQAVVSGILLIFVLAVSILDIAPAISLRGVLRQTLTGATTVGEFAQEVRDAGNHWLGWDFGQIQEDTPEGVMQNPPPYAVTDEQADIPIIQIPMTEGELIDHAEGST